MFILAIIIVFTINIFLQMKEYFDKKYIKEEIKAIPSPSEKEKRKLRELDAKNPNFSKGSLLGAISGKVAKYSLVYRDDKKNK